MGWKHTDSASVQKCILIKKEIARRNFGDFLKIVLFMSEFESFERIDI